MHFKLIYFINSTSKRIKPNNDYILKNVHNNRWFFFTLPVRSVSSRIYILDAHFIRYIKCDTLSLRILRKYSLNKFEIEKVLLFRMHNGMEPNTFLLNFPCCLFQAFKNFKPLCWKVEKLEKKYRLMIKEHKQKYQLHERQRHSTHGQ